MLRTRQEEPARTVYLRVRTATVTIEPPRHRHPAVAQEPVTVNAILVEEIYPPRPGERIMWLLLTTLSIQTWEDIQTAIRWYGESVVFWHALEWWYSGDHRKLWRQ